MKKYLMAVWAARFFSLSPQTRRLYRLLGNQVLQRQRLMAGLPPRYVERARRLVEICQRYQVLQDGDSVVEIGTGWVHWEATILRLFYDVNLALYDVVDNHLLPVYKEYLKQLDRVMDTQLSLNSCQSERAHRLIQALCAAGSFSKIFSLLGARYMINPIGTLKEFPSETYSAIVSTDVLEHVDRRMLPELVLDSYRLLKPGGYAIHQIDLADHFAYYDSSVSPKNYYRYSDQKWDRHFENTVQYFNRVQRPEWSDLFCRAGFELVEQECTYGDIGPLEIDRMYEDLTRQDLECLCIRSVYRRPG